MTAQVILAIVGSLLAVMSVIFGGFLISRKDKAKLQIDKEIIELDRERSTQRNLISSSEHKLNSASTLLYIIQLSQPVLLGKKTISVNVTPIVHNMLGAMTDRYRASKGKPPSIETMESWKVLAKKFADGDNASWEEMNRILSPIHEWAANYNKIGEKIDELKFRKSQLERGADKIKYFSFAFQIIGLIIVLIKDLFK